MDDVRAQTLEEVVLELLDDVRSGKCTGLAWVAFLTSGQSWGYHSVNALERRAAPHFLLEQSVLASVRNREGMDDG